jgi:hypothetical protein
MTAEIVNLNKVRKAKEREAKQRQAEENRVRFGLPKDERTRMATEMARFETALDAFKREPTADSGLAKRPAKNDVKDPSSDPGSAS